MGFPRRKVTPIISPGSSSERFCRRASSMAFFKGRWVFLLICCLKVCPIAFTRAKYPLGLRESAWRHAPLQVWASERQALKSFKQTAQILLMGELLMAHFMS